MKKLEILEVIQRLVHEILCSVQGETIVCKETLLFEKKLLHCVLKVLVCSCHMGGILCLSFNSVPAEF